MNWYLAGTCQALSTPRLEWGSTENFENLCQSFNVTVQRIQQWLNMQQEMKRTTTPLRRGWRSNYPYGQTQPTSMAKKSSSKRKRNKSVLGVKSRKEGKRRKSTRTHFSNIREEVVIFHPKPPTEVYYGVFDHHEPTIQIQIQSTTDPQFLTQRNQVLLPKWYLRDLSSSS